MAGRFPWFPFLVEDWLTSELYLTGDLRSHGLFWNVLAVAWSSSRCSISEAAVRAIARQKDPLGDDEVAELVIAELIPHPAPSCDGLLTHPKLFDLFEERVAKSESAKVRGSLGGKRKARRVAIAKLKGSDPDPEPELEKKKTPLPPSGGRAFGPDDLSALFGKILPELSQPRRPLQKTIRKALEAALKRDGRDPKSWKAYFGEVRDRPFLLGRNRRGWKADLLWILGPRNRAKIEAGAYRDAKGVAPRNHDWGAEEGFQVFDNG
jgi:hypothetical protein